MKRLRIKLGDDAAQPAYIRNEHGIGYRMLEPDDLPAPSASGCSDPAGERHPDEL